jgi:gliding motility-associated-like protein
MQRILLGIIGLLIFAFTVNAQPYSSKDGEFTASQKAGCKTLNVTFNAPICKTDACRLSFNGDPASGTDVPQSTGVLNHSFTDAGTYKVLLVRGGRGAPYDEIDINVSEPTPPTFQISQCGGNQVSVKILESAYDNYVVNYSDGTSSPPVAPNGSDNHLFLDGAGAKTVTVKGLYTEGLDNCPSSSQSVTVGSGLSKTFIDELRVLDGASIKLDFDYQDNVQYGLQVAIDGSATFYQPKSFMNKATDTITNLQADSRTYCFRLATYNGCTNSLISDPYSNTICSSKNFNINIVSNEINSSWIRNNAGVLSTDILIEIPSSTSKFEIPLAPPLSTTYSDKNVECGLTYCYAQRSNYTDGSRAISVTKCGVAFSSTPPDAIVNISSQWLTEGSVGLVWNIPKPFVGKEYYIYKQNGTIYQLSATVNDSTFIDSDEPTCYQIAYTDICGNESTRSKEVCPIVLSGALQSNNDIDLSWTSYVGWKDGEVLQYDLERNESLLESFPGSELQFTDVDEDLSEQTYTYVIKAYPPFGINLPPSISNTITIIKSPNLFHPTAFTPNGDALNDIFNVYGQYIEDFEMSIFNRWGELMYTTTDLELGWDGTFKGTAMPEGTYTFVARIKDFAGRSFERSGSIVLLKNGN